MFSTALLNHRVAKNPRALERIALGKARIQSILDREIVATEKTLEQKIAEHGPVDQRVDPHLITLAITDLLALRRLVINQHALTGTTPWYSNPGRAWTEVSEKLEKLAPLYHTVSRTLSNVIGDALEIATFRALETTRDAHPRYHFDGHFYLDRPKNAHGRYHQRKAPKEMGARSTVYQPDFLQYGHDAGTICVECKNMREWLYPRRDQIKIHILRCSDLDVIPLFVARRIHYSTLTNFFEPAGIIAHESYFQYFPSDQIEVATRAKHKRSLGFSDIIATEAPDQRTIRFFRDELPGLVGPMARKWRQHKAALTEYAKGQINLAQLYTAIGSRAGGKWQEGEPEPEIDR